MKCIQCDRDIVCTEVCCDDGIVSTEDPIAVGNDCPEHPGLVHRDPVCVPCCKPNHHAMSRFEGKRMGGGVLMRGE